MKKVLNNKSLADETGHWLTDDIITPGTVVLGRRYGIPGSSGNRTAILPKSAAPIIIKMAEMANEPIIQQPLQGEEPDRVVYMPSIIKDPGKFTAESQVYPSSGKPADWYNRQHFETIFSKQPDPWRYTHPYEQTKYEFTLSLLPTSKINTALELACAEGHFSEQLAPKVNKLVAADISQIALERAAERCLHMKNIRFMHLDLFKEDIPGKYDLIICSEVLYYVKDRKALKDLAKKIMEALNPGGYLIMAHAHLIVDEPEQPGYDWGLPFGAKIISEIFENTKGLKLSKEIRTPLYRVQRFRREQRTIFSPLLRSKPEIRLEEQPSPVVPRAESTVRWNGGKPSGILAEEQIVTHQLPILMYHRVAPTGAELLTRFRVTPEAFEQQLRYLHESGYYSATWDDWLMAIDNRRPLPGRAIMITFDDGYMDFYQYAWPLLKKYGFTATVFLVADYIGGTNLWDKKFGEELPLMNWKQIHELQEEGTEFGSHSLTHPLMTSLAPSEIAFETAQSRLFLQRELGRPVKTIAYPYGDSDTIVAHIAGACGFTTGLSCQPRLSSFQDNTLLLPRLEIRGSDSLQDFIAKLSV